MGLHDFVGAGGRWGLTSRTTITKVLRSDPASSSQRKKLLAGALVLAQVPMERRRDRARTGLLHAAQRHAHVLGLEHDADAARRQMLVEPAGDLRGHALL